MIFLIKFCCIVCPGGAGGLWRCRDHRAGDDGDQYKGETHQGEFLLIFQMF